MKATLFRGLHPLDGNTHLFERKPSARLVEDACACGSLPTGSADHGWGMVEMAIAAQTMKIQVPNIREDR